VVTTESYGKLQFMTATAASLLLPLDLCKSRWSRC